MPFVGKESSMIWSDMTVSSNFQQTGYLYEVPYVEANNGVNGGPIQGYSIPGEPMTAAAAAALIQKEVG